MKDEQVCKKLRKMLAALLRKAYAADPVKLKVEVVPDKDRGTGVGAQLEIGHAEIQ